MSTISGITVYGRPLTTEAYLAGDLERALLNKPTAGRTPGNGYVNFYALDGSVDLTVLMGNGPATLTGGDGGWVEEPRRGQEPVTWWNAPSSYRQSIPVMFDGNSQEQAINDLISLARSPGSRRPPPALMVTGQGVHRADLVWVMEPLEPGSNVRRRESDGNRTRQDYTVKLLHYTGVDVIVERSPSRQAAARNGHSKTQAGRGVTSYRVKAGDNLPKIAARKEIYGDASLWKRIANANGIRDPRSLVVGRVLKIPRG